MSLTMCSGELNTVKLPCYDGFDQVFLLPMPKTVSRKHYLNPKLNAKISAYFILCATQS